MNWSIYESCFDIGAEKNDDFILLFMIKPLYLQYQTFSYKYHR